MTFVDLVDVVRELQKFCDCQTWRSCFIGGIGVQRWGGPRVTRDVDLTLLTGFGPETPFIERLLTYYRSRVPDPIPFALQSRVVLLLSPSGVGIDISLGALPFQDRIVERASLWDLSPAIALPLAAAKEQPEILCQLTRIRALASDL